MLLKRNKIKILQMALRIKFFELEIKFFYLKYLLWLLNIPFKEQNINLKLPFNIIVKNMWE